MYTITSQNPIVGKLQNANWRRYVAQRLADAMDMNRFGVKGLYLIGSAERGDAGLGSDIDLIVHVENDHQQQVLLSTWLEGWNHALCNMHYLNTGYQCETMLDVHFVTDTDIELCDSYAVHIFSVYEPAEQLRVLDT